MNENEPKILLVEDSPTDAELTMLALQKSNMANPIDLVRDGAEALEYLFGTGAYAWRAERCLPQLVLLDLRLPKLDGIEVLQQIRANPRTRRLPVVIMTSSNEETDMARCYDHGANSYIRKPVDFEHFVQTIRQLGLYWLVLNEPPPLE